MGDSMLNEVSEKGLSWKYNLQVSNIPGTTSEQVLEKILRRSKVDDILKTRSDSSIIYVGKYGIMNGANLFNSGKIIIIEI